MRTVKEVSRLTGVSVRTLQYYDAIGLLPPTAHTDAGYRLYDDTALEQLQQILLFRELEFPLREIRAILQSPDFDRDRALAQQIDWLTLKKEHLENLIDFARKIKATGVKNMDFTVFDTKKIDEYAKRAKEQWGQTPEYREYEEKTKDWTNQDQQDVMKNFMLIFAEFGKMRTEDPASEKVQCEVEKLQNFISEHFYQCSDEILSGLGQMYASGGEFTQNIDKMGGEGTARFTADAIEVYCKK